MGYMLTAEALEATREKIEKINAKASKKGLSGRLEVIAEETTVKHDIAGIPVEEIRFETTITGEPPKHNGWVFLASLEWIETGVITRNAPGSKVNVERAVLRPGFCDHCGYNRRRKETYVVLNEETGQQMQVGSTCLKDFLGWSGTVVFFTDDDVEREIGGFLNYGSPVYTTESILAVAWACVTTFGYKKAHEDNPTKSVVWEVMGARENKYNRKLKEQIRPIAVDAVPMAQKLREFILSDEFWGDSDYVLNLKTYCEAETNTARSFGFLASVPQAYARHLDKTFKREKELANTVNEWVGEEKDKLTLNVKIKSVRYIDSDFGVTVLYTLFSDTGHTFKWFASRAALGEDVTPENGDFFVLKGTVKKHEDFNGQKSTVLTRCKKI